MLRDLILASRILQSLNGDPPLGAKLLFQSAEKCYSKVGQFRQPFLLK